MQSFEKKIVKVEDLMQITAKIVFTNGCFDIIHRGHVTYLAQAKQLGEVLVVALNSDLSVRKLNKGSNRPINSLDNRMAVIASLQSVDYVTYFDEDTPLKLIKLIKPSILVKGGDWSIDKIVGSHDTRAWGGEVYSIPFLYNTSTTKIIDKINNVSNN